MIEILPKIPNHKVFLKLPEKAIINDKKSIITLIEVHPSTIRET